MNEGHVITEKDLTSNYAVHMIRDFKDEGWIVRWDEQEIAQGQSQEDVLCRARAGIEQTTLLNSR